MRRPSLHISLLLIIIVVLMSCDRTPRGVLSMNAMADLIVDLQLADAYIESHPGDFTDDSSIHVIKLVLAALADFIVALLEFSHGLVVGPGVVLHVVGIPHQRTVIVLLGDAVLFEDGLLDDQFAGIIGENKELKY